MEYYSSFPSVSSALPAPGAKRFTKYRAPISRTLVKGHSCIFIVYKFGASILDHKYCTGRHLSGKTSAAIALLVPFKSSGSHAEGYIDQRKDNGITYMNGIATTVLADTKPSIPLNNEFTVSLKLFSFSMFYLLMSPSVDDVFYIFIEIKLCCCFENYNSINPSL